MFNTGPHFESKPQSFSLRFPKGMGLVVESELKEVLDNCFTPLKFKPELFVTENSLKINNFSLLNATELCLRLTTVRDVIWELGTGRVQSKSDIVKLVKKVSWNKIFPDAAQIALRVSTSNSKLYHSGLVHEAFSDALGSLGYEICKKDKAFTILNISLNNNNAFLGLSLVGASLNIRGYRHDLSHQAPLNECLAACAVRYAKSIASNGSSGYQIDVPFAGSGTFGFEALLALKEISPNIYRKSYAIERMPFSSKSLIAHTRKKSRELTSNKNIEVYFSDTDTSCLSKLQEHIKSFACEMADSKIDFSIEGQDFFSSKIKFNPDRDICLFLNPPYGERLKKSENYFKKLALAINSRYANHASSIWGVCLTPKGSESEAFKRNLKAKEIKFIKASNGGLSIELIAFLLK